MQQHRSRGPFTHTMHEALQAYITVRHEMPHLEESRHGMKTITVPVEGLNFASCAQSIEKRVGAFSGVQDVAASYVTQTVTMTFDEATISEATMRDLVRDCGFACGRTCDPVEMLAQAAATETARTPATVAQLPCAGGPMRQARKAPGPPSSAVASPPAHEHIHDHPMEPAGGRPAGAMADHPMANALRLIARGTRWATAWVTT